MKEVAEDVNKKSPVKRPTKVMGAEEQEAPSGETLELRLENADMETVADDLSF